MSRRTENPELSKQVDIYDRLRSSLDVETLAGRMVSIVGGAFGLACDLARCGAGAINMCDFDRVQAANVPRQDFDQREAGSMRLKVQAVAERIAAINPSCRVTTYPVDVTMLGSEEADRFFGQADLVIAAADDFLANAHANAEAMRRGTSILHASLYAGGGAGEIIYWVSNVTPACYRCIASDRYRHFSEGQSSKTPSAGATIFDLRSVDTVAGQIALGLLTRGSDNRYGRLIDALGSRNLIQIRNDPDWLLGGRKDIFKIHLGDSPANFSFTAACLPMEAEQECPDCALFKGHRA